MICLAVDIGSTSLKAALIDECGNVFAYRRIPFFVLDKRSASELWFSSLRNAIFSMRENANEKKIVSQIAAIAISGNGPTLVSENGTTLLWNEELPKKVSDEIQSVVAEKKLQASIFIPRILAFQKLFPNEWKIANTIFSGPEFLVFQLTGECVTFLPEKRFEKAYWNNDALFSLSIDEKKFPRFVSFGNEIGKTSAKTNEMLGLEKSVSVFCAGPDFIAAMIGTASLEDGKLYDRAGSSEGINFATSEALFANDIRTLPSVQSDLWNAAVLHEQSGKLFVHYKQILEAVHEKEIPYREIISESIRNKNSDGFAILEFVANNFSKAASILISEAKKKNMRVLFPMMVTGGQAKNDEWMQMKANYANLPLATCACKDAELLGGAATAFFGARIFSSLKEASKAIVKIDKVFEPN